MATKASSFDLQDMALFVAVGRALNFTRASAACGVPIATLSRRITLLEKRVGVRLFERSSRQLTLTDAGRRYFERCERIVQDADAAHDALNDAAQQPCGHLRISMPVEFGLVTLAPLVDEFALNYPGVTMELDLTPRHAGRADVDVAIRLGEVHDSTLVARRLGSIVRELYASPQYVARHGAPTTPPELGAHDCITVPAPTGGARWLLVRGGALAEVGVGGRFATNNVSMMQRLAEYGHGIATLPPAFAGDAREAGKLVRVLEDWTFAPMPVHALMSTRLMPARVRAFVDFVAARLTAC